VNFSARVSELQCGSMNFSVSTTLLMPVFNASIE